MASSYVTTLFGQSIKSVLDGWTALQLAVTQGFGGPDSKEKAEWMVYAIETWFKENANIETYELEDFLCDVLNTEFDMLLEDSSTLQISNAICKFYRLCQEGKEEEVRASIQSMPQAALQQCVKSEVQNQELEYDGTEDGSEASGSNNGIVSASQANSPPQQQQDQNNSTESEDMEVEEGWEVVKRGKKK